MCIWAATAITLMLLAGCTHHVQQQSAQITVYFCRAGTGTLVPISYTIDPKLDGTQREKYALGQLLAGPAGVQTALVLFPSGTQAAVKHAGDTATVDLKGPIAKSFSSGTSDEIALFKSLTYTLTALPNVKSVQVLIGGQKLAALPGGHIELDEPLTRETFAQ